MYPPYALFHLPPPISPARVAFFLKSLPLPLPIKAYLSSTCCPTSFPEGPDYFHSLPETEAKALLKERQKKDNHNLSE